MRVFRWLIFLPALFLPLFLIEVVFGLLLGWAMFNGIKSASVLIIAAVLAGAFTIILIPVGFVFPYYSVAKWAAGRVCPTPKLGAGIGGALYVTAWFRDPLGAGATAFLLVNPGPMHPMARWFFLCFIVMRVMWAGAFIMGLRTAFMAEKH